MWGKRVKKSHEIDLVNGNLVKNLILVALPLVATSLLQLFYTSCDLIVCNKFGSDLGTAAISSTTSLVNLLITLGVGLSAGTNILISRYYGANNKDAAQKALYTSIIIALIFGFVVGVIGFDLSKYFLVWMGSPEETIELSTQYLKIYFAGLPFLAIYNFGSAILRAIGDTRRPFFILLFAGLANVGFNLFFDIVLNMDVAGVALGTVISEAISAVSVMVILIKENGFLHFKFKEIRFSKTQAKEILKIGIPAGLQGVIFSISNVVLQSSINSLGPVIMGAQGAANTLEGFVFVSMNSVATANVAFVSANYGAKNKANIKKCILISYAMVIAINIIVGIPLFIFSDQLIGLYVSGAEALYWARKKLYLIVATYFLCGFMDCLAQAQRGIKHPTLPTITTFIGNIGTRLLWVYLFTKIDAIHNLPGLAVCYPLSWLITLIIHAIVFTTLYKKLDFSKEENDKKEIAKN